MTGRAPRAPYVAVHWAADPCGHASGRLETRDRNKVTCGHCRRRLETLADQIERNRRNREALDEMARAHIERRRALLVALARELGLSHLLANDEDAPPR